MDSHTEEGPSLKLKPRCNQEAVVCNHRHSHKCKVDSEDGSHTDQPNNKLKHSHSLLKLTLSRTFKTQDQVSKSMLSRTFKTEDQDSYPMLSRIFKIEDQVSKPMLSKTFKTEDLVRPIPRQQILKI